MEIAQAGGPGGPGELAQMVLSKTSSPLIVIPIITNAINTNRPHIRLSTGDTERCPVPASLQSIFFSSSRDLRIWRDQPEIPGKDVEIQYGGRFSEERKTEWPSPFKIKI